MIGVYDYTVILTYCSLISATIGILASLNGAGHPYIGVFFLLLCGLFDAFDGKIARTKKNRTTLEQNFGIQIDSLSDLIAFGVLPACIGNAMLRVYPALDDKVPSIWQDGKICLPIQLVFFAILVLYVLAALIRLAYFNVTEEERQKNEGGVREYYQGMPVTSSALIFPSYLLLQYILPTDITRGYFAVMLVLGFAFLGKFKIKKPGMRALLILSVIGLVEFALFVIIWNRRRLGL